MDVAILQNPQTYSVTLSLPNEFQSDLEQITTNYLTLIQERNLKYIQCYEYNKKGIKHCHIMYEAEDQKSTSNETKKFKDCYNFNKSDHPKAISHHKHNNNLVAVGYCQKAPIEPVNTNYDNNHLNKGDEAYKLQIIPDKKKETSLSINRIGNEITNYIQTNIETYWENIHHDIDKPINHWFNANMHQITLQTYQKLNRQKLYEYVKHRIDLTKYFI